MTGSLLLHILLLLQSSDALCTLQRAELPLPQIPIIGRGFGNLDLAGRLAAVGSPFTGTGGAVILFAEREGRWKQELVLEPPRPSAGEGFGTALLLGSERLLVSAFASLRSDGVASGSLYVYEREDGAWHFREQIFPQGSSRPEFFGVSLALDGERILAGAPDVGGGSGAVYVFRQDESGPGGWVQEARLVPSPAPALGAFGTAVGLQGDTALIGAPGRALVHVYQRAGDGWRLVERLQDAPGSGFGTSLALQGDCALVGAPYWPDGTIPYGAVRAYERRDGSWQPTETLTAQGPTSFGFGSSVDLDGELAAIGSLGYLGFIPSHGTWLVGRDGDRWREPQAVVPLGSPASFPHGNQAALADRTLLVLEPALSGSGSAAFFFDVGQGLGGSVVARQGAGNLQALDAGPAALGATLVFTLDPFPGGASSARVFAFESPAALPVAGGTLLCQDAGSGLLFRSPPIARAFQAVTRWGLAVPPAAELAGFSFCAQAVFHSLSPPLVLTNALDIRLGSCSCPLSAAGEIEVR